MPHLTQNSISQGCDFATSPEFKKALDLFFLKSQRSRFIRDIPRLERFVAPTTGANECQLQTSLEVDPGITAFAFFGEGTGGLERLEGWCGYRVVHWVPWDITNRNVELN
jgi:hypothetical protein